MVPIGTTLAPIWDYGTSRVIFIHSRLGIHGKAFSKAVVLPLQKQWFYWSKALLLIVKSTAFQNTLKPQACQEGASQKRNHE